jgi:hypothetical protein
MSEEAKADDVEDVNIGDEESPAVEQAKPEEPAAKEPLAVSEATLDSSKFPLFVVMIASVVLLIATGVEYGWNFANQSSFANYAISISSIGIILSFFEFFLTFYDLTSDIYSKFVKPMDVVLFLYSFVGACFLTFHEPFTETSNGYFAAWAMAYGSALAIGMDADAFKSKVKALGAVVGLLASSVIVIIASIDPVKNDFWRGEALYALVLSCVTAAFILFVLALDKRGTSLPGGIYSLVMTTLAVAWIVEACFVTFRGPFKLTGNGYFASWAGAATSSFGALAAMHMRKD